MLFGREGATTRLMLLHLGWKGLESYWAKIALEYTDGNSLVMMEGRLDREFFILGLFSYWRLCFISLFSV